MSSGSSIDLAKGKSTLTEDIIRWALGFGRFIIIVVEVVAFSAFIYRFVLDRQLVDLNDKIKAEEAIVRSLKDREAEYRNLQQRIKTVKDITDTGNTKLTIFNDIVALTPQEISYERFSAENDQLQIKIDITSIPALTTYLDALKGYKQIESVGVTSIENSSEANTVTVELVAKLKGVSK